MATDKEQALRDSGVTKFVVNELPSSIGMLEMLEDVKIDKLLVHTVDGERTVEFTICEPDAPERTVYRYKKPKKEEV